METLLPVSARSLQYYVIAKKWQADLEFLRVESGFLQQILEQCTGRFQDQAHFQQLIKSQKELQDLDQLAVDDLLSGQIRQLELMAEDIIPEDAEALAAAQIKLELYMTGLTKTFRRVKREIYQLVLVSPKSFNPLMTGKN